MTEVIFEIKGDKKTMMEIKGNMMSVREDVRVLDATLRDGGLSE